MAKAAVAGSGSGVVFKVRPSAGTARVVSASGAGDTVSCLGDWCASEFDAAGYDVFVYEACDRLRNCVSAEATVAVWPGPVAAS